MKKTNMTRKMNEKYQIVLNNLQDQLKQKGYTNKVTNKFISLTEENEDRIKREIAIVRSRVLK